MRSQPSSSVLELLLVDCTAQGQVTGCSYGGGVHVHDAAAVEKELQPVDCTARPAACLHGGTVCAANIRCSTCNRAARTDRGGHVPGELGRGAPHIHHAAAKRAVHWKAVCAKHGRQRAASKVPDAAPVALFAGAHDDAAEDAGERAHDLGGDRFLGVVVEFLDVVAARLRRRCDLHGTGLSLLSSCTPSPACAAAVIRTEQARLGDNCVVGVAVELVDRVAAPSAAAVICMAAVSSLRPSTGRNENSEARPQIGNLMLSGAAQGPFSWHCSEQFAKR